MEVLGRFCRIAELLSALASNRLALFSIEIREELARQYAHLALMLACCAFLGLGVLFAATAVLIVGWQSGHLLASAVALAVAFLLLAAVVALVLRQRLRAAPPPFPATIAEFTQDVAALRKHEREAK